MTEREQAMHDAADRHAMAFLDLEHTAGMIKGKRLRGSQEKRMRTYIKRQLKNDGYGSIELWIFIIVNLSKIMYAAWKLWQERHQAEMMGHA